MESKSSLVYRSLEQKITTGEYQPGDRLPSESELCAEFSVSRGPVRTALDKLMAIGLIMKKKGGGSYVCRQDSASYLSVLLPNLRFHTNDFREILELRYALDKQSIKLCLEHHENNDYEALDAIMESLEDDHSVDEFFNLDKAFHLAISHLSGNHLIHNVNILVWDLMEHCPREGYIDEDIDVQVEELRKIFRSIKNNDVELASIYTNRHLKRIMHQDEKALEPGQDSHRWNPWLYETL